MDNVQLFVVEAVIDIQQTILIKIVKYFDSIMWTPNSPHAPGWSLAPLNQSINILNILKQTKKRQFSSSLHMSLSFLTLPLYCNKESLYVVIYSRGSCFGNRSLGSGLVCLKNHVWSKSTPCVCAHVCLGVCLCIYLCERRYLCLSLSWKPSRLVARSRPIALLQLKEEVFHWVILWVRRQFYEG